MRIPGSPFEQAGTRLYVGLVRAGDIAERVESGDWAPDIYRLSNPEGYQRALSEARAKEFGRFVVRGGVCPLSILLNFRDGEVKQAQEGLLDLPEGRAYIVDGQHRAEGIRQAVTADSSVAEYVVPVIVMNTADQYGEAKQFVIINRTQKGVRADLAERFLLQAVKREGRETLIAAMDSGILRRVLRGAEWITKAVEIADILASDSKSPWYRAIRMPNEPRNGSVVAQKSFTDSLEPVLKDSYFQGKDARIIAAALRNYWAAIRDLCPQAFEEPREFVLQRTSGVKVLHKVFTRVSELCIDNHGNRVLTPDAIREVLAGLSQMDSTYWGNNGEAGRRGTGNKGVTLLAMEFLESLEERVQNRDQSLIV